MAADPSSGSSAVRTDQTESAWMLWLLLVVATVSTLISPLSRDLFAGDETRYGRVVHEMEKSGDYLVPHLNGEPYAHKPPVHFWIIIVGERLLGSTTIFPFVLPSLLAHFLTLALTGWWTRRRFGAVAGLVAVGALGSFWLAWGSAQSARMDHTYSLLLVLAVILIDEHLESGHRSSLILAGAVTGIATLVKGPMIMLIVVVFFVGESVRRRIRPGLSAALSLLTIIGIVSLWFFPAIVSGGTSYGEEMVVDQSLGRAFSSWVHAAPPWFYLIRSPLTFFPWAVMLALGLWTAWSERRKDESVGVVITWFASVFIPYSLISGKLDVYMLLAMPPAAIIIGWLATKERWSRVWKWNGVVVSFLTALVALAANLAVPFLDQTDPEIAPWVTGEIRVIFWLITVSGLLIGVASLSSGRDRLKQISLTGLAAIVPMIIVIGLGIGLVNEESSTVRLNRVLERTGVTPERIALHWTPYLWGTEMDPSLHEVFYGYPDEMPSTPSIVVVRRDHTADLGEQLDGYRNTATIRMISKEFDVYRRD